MRWLLVVFSLLSTGRTLLSQKLDSVSLSNYRRGRTLYLDGQRYRTGSGVVMDYAKAFRLFEQSSSLGFPMGEYSLGYMYYKGLGCQQDYEKAVSLFRKGISQGFDNSMYFMGLCFRNGYGVPTNRDSATYWLKFADSLGSRQAALELSSMTAENMADSANGLLEDIRNGALPQQVPLNSFVKIVNRQPSSEVVSGRYKGFLIQYDWSGNHVVSAKKMELALSEENGYVNGEWVEEATDSFHFSATLRSDSMVFSPVSYGRRDHYSPDSAISYRLSGASVSIVQSQGTVYLAGNVNMFSEDRGEPSKPMILALSRSSADLPIATVFTFDKVYPNPFRDVLEVDFSLGGNATVAINVTDALGRQVYLRPGQRLQKGSYAYRLELPVGMPPGIYFLQATVDGKPHAYKLAHI